MKNPKWLALTLVGAACVGSACSSADDPGASGGNGGTSDGAVRAVTRPAGRLRGEAGTAGSAGTAGAAGLPPVRPGLVTSGSEAYWQEGALTEVTGAGIITVNTSQTFQDWIGFGGTFNEAGWDALGELSAEDRDRAMRLLFGAHDGANFKWGRIPIGASDYAMDRYTLNESAGDRVGATSALGSRRA